MLRGRPCCVVHDGAAGNRRQAWALAAALGVDATELVLQPTAPVRWFGARGGAGGAPGGGRLS
jgi:hypothetical protein